MKFEEQLEKEIDEMILEGVKNNPGDEELIKIWEIRNERFISRNFERKQKRKTLKKKDLSFDKSEETKYRDLEDFLDEEEYHISDINVSSPNENEKKSNSGGTSLNLDGPSFDLHLSQSAEGTKEASLINAIIPYDPQRKLEVETSSIQYLVSPYAMKNVEVNSSLTDEEIKFSKSVFSARLPAW